MSFLGEQLLKTSVSIEENHESNFDNPIRSLIKYYY